MEEIGKIEKRPITQEMEESYLSYAMSVIVQRALPDVRDGLKPVHRRILYAMWRLGLKHTAKFRKSATVVGEVLGKYHPHGDSAVYYAMVRMAQDFSLRDMLVEGQGNFGSMDGDNPAAMRYTEARLRALAEEMLFDIDKETVDFVDNYDGTRKEPSFLPAKFPQLLLNGTVGIAVGMATNIPPHNLSELVDGIVAYIENKEITIEELVEFIKAPDFPTGGTLYNQKDIVEAYRTGRGGLVTRAKTDIVESKRGLFQIVITEITYQTNKSTLVSKIADLVKDGKIMGIKDLRDESDKDGVRIVIDLKKDAFPKKILNKLYTSTELQKTFHLNMLALVEGIEPRILNLKSIIEQFVSHRQNIVTRRTKFELNKAKARAHILEGLKKALDHINKVISTIKKSPTKEEAHNNLIKNFSLSDLQTEAILEMKLQTLAGLERKKIEDELEEKKKLIKKLEDILKSPKKILNIIKKELFELQEKYGTPRKTAIIKGAVGDFSQEDLIANEEAIISLTEDGYIKRLPCGTFRTQKRGGTGVIGSSIKKGDAVDKVLSSMTHDMLFLFTNTGKVFSLKTYEIPTSSRTAKGQAIVNFLQIAPSEKITSILTIPKDSKARYMVMQTVNGTIKKTPLEDFEKVRRSGLIAIRLQKDDSLGWVETTSSKDDLIIATKNGQSIRFKESQVRQMGRAAAGVRAIRLKNDDFVISMSVIRNSYKKPELLVISEKGYGKRTSLKKYKVQSRGGSGIKTANITSKTGGLISAHVTEDVSGTDLIASSNKGQIIRTTVKDISILGRSTQGVKIMRLKSGEKVAATTVM
ncbi:MAG: DNA gyrase subunit A [Patescibacteria group bacterium]|nr:DNA gyrase subunit A [Patescibacteria group bacterium]